MNIHAIQKIISKIKQKNTINEKKILLFLGMAQLPSVDCQDRALWAEGILFHRIFSLTALGARVSRPQEGKGAIKADDPIDGLFRETTDRLLIILRCEKELNILHFDRLPVCRGEVEHHILHPQILDVRWEVRTPSFEAYSHWCCRIDTPHALDKRWSSGVIRNT
jgi:hypothetical protein